MKIKQYIETDGITSSLSFQVSHEALRDLLRDSAYAYSNEELEDLALLQAEQIHQMFFQAGKSFRLGLMTSYASSLRDAVDLKT